MPIADALDVTIAEDVPVASARTPLAWNPIQWKKKGPTHEQ